MPEVGEFKLTPEQVSQLKGMSTDIAKARLEISRLKKIGLDTSTLEQSLGEAVRLRDDLIKVYG